MPERGSEKLDPENVMGSEKIEDREEKEGVFELKFDQKIVKHNLKMLFDDMEKLLLEESIGGNAGSIEIDGKKYPCAVANGYVSQTTGEIVVFGNIQDIKNPEILKNNLGITLRSLF